MRNNLQRLEALERSLSYIRHADTDVVNWAVRIIEVANKLSLEGLGPLCECTICQLRRLVLEGKE